MLSNFFFFLLSESTRTDGLLSAKFNEVSKVDLPCPSNDFVLYVPSNPAGCLFRQVVAILISRKLIIKVVFRLEISNVFYVK